MTLGANELCASWGNYNVAWELVSDLKLDGYLVVNSEATTLTPRQRRQVQRFLDCLDKIPSSLLAGATTAAANVAAMSHPAWVPYKNNAAALLNELAQVAEQNRRYFDAGEP